jgi:hypothetical protein
LEEAKRKTREQMEERYRNTSNLRKIQFLNVSFMKNKFESFTFREFKNHFNFSVAEICEIFAGTGSGS